MPSLKARIVFLAALVVAFGAPTASAGLVTLTFGGDFSGVGDFNGVNTATTFTASLTFESTTPDSFPGDPTFGDYAAVTSFTLDVGSFSFSSVSVSSSTIVVVDGVPDDYEATVSGANAFGDTLDVVLLLSDNEGTAFSSDVLPVVLPFSEFEVKQFTAAIFQAGEFNSDLQGTLTSVTPEPTTLTLLAFGGIFLRFRRRR